MYHITIPIKPHLKKFLIYEYGQDPIKIDRDSALGILMHCFLIKSYSLPETYLHPTETIKIVIPHHVYEYAGHSLKPYQVSMLNNLIDGIFRDILFASIILTQATYPERKESHFRNITARNKGNQKYYRQKFEVKYAKPYIKDVLKFALSQYGITEDDIKTETLLKDYQRTVQRRMNNKPASKTFHPQFTKPKVENVQQNKLFA